MCFKSPQVLLLVAVVANLQLAATLTHEWYIDNVPVRPQCPRCMHADAEPARQWLLCRTIRAQERRCGHPGQAQAVARERLQCETARRYRRSCDLFTLASPPHALMRGFALLLLRHAPACETERLLVPGVRV
jgi:hypothetical protein